MAPLKGSTDSPWLLSRQPLSLALPIVLLSIKISLKTDLYWSSADLVYGTTLRLPGELLVPAPNAVPCSAQDFAALLRHTKSDLQPVQPHSPHGKTFVHQDLEKCTYVFVRVNDVWKPLHRLTRDHLR